MYVGHKILISENSSDCILFWTRSQKDQAEDRLSLKEFNHPVVYCPTFDIKSIPLSDTTITSFSDIILLTSLNGAKRFCEFSPNMDTPKTIYTFSQKIINQLTCDKVHKVHLIKAKSATEFIHLFISSCLVEKTQKITYLAVKQPAVNLKDILENHGFSVDFIPIYENMPILIPSEESKKFFQCQSKQKVVCFCSPSAVRNFSAQIDAINSVKKSEFLTVSIGETTRNEAKKYFENNEIAEDTTVNSVIEKAAELIRCS